MCIGIVYFCGLVGMSKEDLERVRLVIASLLNDEIKYRDDAKKDRLFELVAHHVGGIRTLERLASIIDDMAANYGEISK